MAPDELNRAMKYLGINKSNYERVFLSHERTVRRWIAGSCPIPGPVAAYIRVMVRDDVPIVSAGGREVNTTQSLAENELI